MGEPGVDAVFRRPRSGVRRRLRFSASRPAASLVSTAISRIAGVTMIIRAGINIVVYASILGHSRRGSSCQRLRSMPASYGNGAQVCHLEKTRVLQGRLAIATPMSDAIIQNTPGQSEGYAVGVPKDYAWCSGSYKPAGSSAPPSDFTAVTGKGQVYPKAGARAYSSPDGSITIANAKTYVHLSTTREWILVQDQATDEIAGAHFVADFSPNTGQADEVRRAAGRQCGHWRSSGRIQRSFLANQTRHVCGWKRRRCVCADGHADE